MGLEKRRLPGAGPVVASHNRILGWLGGRSFYPAGAALWQARELMSFRLLNRGYAASASGRLGVWTERLPGEDLRSLLEGGRLTRREMRAAGAAFAQVHALRDPETGACWSHGAPRLENVVYDEASREARLVDFEAAHLGGLDPVERHADDLLHFLLDLAGRAPAGSPWPGLASSFLTFYGVNPVRKRLVRRLACPSAVERAVWRGLGVEEARLERLRWCYLT